MAPWRWLCLALQLGPCLVLAVEAPAFRTRSTGASRKASRAFWTAGQPYDLELGNMFAGELKTPVPRTPPPSPESLRLQTKCPLMLNSPTAFVVEAPSPCRGSADGQWLVPGGTSGAFASWSQDCTSGGGLPQLRYTLPSGELLATSQAAHAFFGSSTIISDCEGQARYVVTEKVIKVAGAPDREVCEQYGSCDGVVMLQLGLEDKNGTVLASTKGLKLFQETFELQDPKGDVVASFAHSGDWRPVGGTCDELRRWSVRLTQSNSPVPGWLAAAFITVVAERDARRKSTGLVGVSTCDLWSAGEITLLALLFLAGAAVVGIVFMRIGVPRTRMLLVALEKAICPKKHKLRQSSHWHA